MKRIIQKLGLVLLTGFYPVVMNAYSLDNLQQEFNPLDFSIKTGVNTHQYIESLQEISFDESDDPQLPYISKDIIIPKGIKFKSVSSTYQIAWEEHGVILDSNPVPIPTDGSYDGSQIPSVRYNKGVFPSTNCRYAGVSQCENFQILHMQFCPFIYDSSDLKLSFLGEIRFSIEFDGGVSSIKREMTRTERNLMSQNLFNPDVISGFGTSWNVEYASEGSRLDYLIVTNESLKDSFIPLLDWKKDKGLFAKIVTVEEIDSCYQGNDLPYKIKLYLHDLYERFGLQYVLLGGDDTIVPVRGCYGEVSANDSEHIDYEIPTDLYYSCFNGNFSWRVNNNHLYGLPDANIDLMPQIYISRLPVRNHQEVTAATSKIISYEKKPLFHNKMLLTGVKLFGYCDDTKTFSDSDAKLCNMRAKSIDPYWQGSIDMFCDTYTDFPGYWDYDVTATNLQDRLETGYDFVSVLTHGAVTHWKMEFKSNYSYSFAETLYNLGHTIITTSACWTNAFDSNAGWQAHDPCLGESFIRNENSGVVAYIGSSRYGWEYISSDGELGPSLEYESRLYKSLLNNKIKDKSLGSLVANAKYSLASRCKSNGAFRWLQFAINPMGDPEMQLYTTRPEEITGFNFQRNGGKIQLFSDIDSCRISIRTISGWNTGSQEVVYNAETAHFNVPIGYINIGLYRPGYLPLTYKLCTLQNETLDNYASHKADYIEVGSSISSTKPNGNVVFKSGQNILNAKEVVLQSGTEICLGAELYIIHE